MKKLLNTLYITRQESYLHKERETIVIKLKGEKLAQFPALTIGNILCFGQVSVSPFLMGYCAEQGIGLAFYTEYGRFLARVQGPKNGNVLLRRQQYRWADAPTQSLSISQNIIAAKIANTRRVLQRDIRNHGKNDALEKAISQLAVSLRRVRQSVDLDELRGIEGDAAASYFAVFNQLVRTEGFEFSGRIKRPPTDRVNALLSLVYSLITNECTAALQAVGLDPYVGFLHRDRPGRAGLALDIVEEFRAAWADRFVLTLINRRQLSEKDFITEASGAVRLTDDARKQLLVAYQERKQDELLHPYLEEKVPIGLLPHCQAMLLARYIRGDMKTYPPYTMK